MKRHILFYDGPIQITEPGFDSIHINQIDSIANRSCDIVQLPVIEYIKTNDLQKTIVSTLSKIRPDGYLHINFLDSKKIAKDYLANKISSSDFLRMFHNKYNLLSFDYFTTIIDLGEYDIVNYSEGDNYQNHIVIRKIPYLAQ